MLREEQPMFSVMIEPIYMYRQNLKQLQEDK
jgi:hypothetical protein